MRILAKRTTEVTPAEIAGIYSLFEEVFHKKRDAGIFTEQFGNTAKGYSYHAIALSDDGQVVGHNAYVPFIYQETGGEPFLVSLSIDAMIHPDFRKKGLYRSMLETCERMAVADGCKIRVGFPNDNSYPVQVKGFKYTDIGVLDTYVLPVRVGGIKPALSVLNFLTKGFAWTMAQLSKLPGGNRKYTYKYAKQRETFNQYRYKWFGNAYSRIELPGGAYAVYKTSDYKGIEATFLMDVYPLSRRNFDSAVREIMKREKNLNLLLYVGNLPFSPLSMIRIPQPIAPKKFHFVGKLLDKEYFKPEEILNLKNWELNLSNFDLL